MEKYYKKYKEIMDVRYEWHKMLPIKERIYLWGSLILGMLLIAVELIVYIWVIFKLNWHINILLITEAILAALIVATTKMDEKLFKEVVKRGKQNVAQQYHKGNFGELMIEQDDQFRLYLQSEEIETREQIELLINEIDKKKKELAPSKWLNIGCIGAMGLTAWTIAISRLYEIFDFITATIVAVASIIMTMIIMICFRPCKEIIKEFIELRHRELIKLEEMKGFLLQMELKILGNGEEKKKKI